MNKETRAAMDRAFAAADQAFNHADQAFRHADAVYAATQTSTMSETTTVRFKDRRWRLFRRFLSLAWRALLHGEVRLNIRLK